MMSLPLQFGSFHDSVMVEAVEEWRMDTMDAGLDGGVTHVPTEL